MSKLTIYMTTTDTRHGMESQVFTTEDQAWASLFDGFNATQEEYDAWKLEQSDPDEADRYTFLRSGGHLDHLDSFSLELVEVDLPQPYASAPALLSALKRCLAELEFELENDPEASLIAEAVEEAKAAIALTEGA